ncbi:MAG: Na+/H+ antiporter subunit E [Cyclobacteriaceae bacterium]|nr:Na+/H+ antiporter subunit E [Cyclobacteriaceae bacterium]
MKILYKLLGVLDLTGHYLKLMVLSNLKVAAEVLTPPLRMKPAIIGVDLDIESDFGIFLLVNLITMTPGTMSLDLSDDRKILYVHIMNIKEIQEDVDQIKLLEDKIKKITGK